MATCLSEETIKAFKRRENTVKEGVGFRKNLNATSRPVEIAIPQK